MTLKNNLVNKLITYLGYYFSRFSAINNILYIAKTIASLPIIYNKSKITQKNNLINKLYRAFYFARCIK